MDIGDKIFKPVQDWNEYANAAEWCNNNQAHIEDKGGYYEIVANPVSPVTIKDYDDAMEAHLLAERSERGYSAREPSPYYDDSANARWKQDAADWKTHRDAVMEYALQVENDYAEGKDVPTLEEFKAALPKIHWTLTVVE